MKTAARSVGLGVLLSVERAMNEESEKKGSGDTTTAHATIPFPTNTPAQRLERDLYSAIVGHPPVIDPSLAAKESHDAPKPVGDLARAWSPVAFARLKVAGFWPPE